ncbi:MAG: hypothetical protein ACE5J6_03360 [Candidatus Bathyarchaeia archaeon]
MKSENEKTASNFLAQHDTNTYPKPPIIQAPPLTNADLSRSQANRCNVANDAETNQN